MMTKLLVKKENFYDVSKVTRDHAPAFSAAANNKLYSVVIKPHSKQDEKTWSQVLVYSGRYNGLNRALLSIDFEMPSNELVAKIMNGQVVLGVQFGESTDYFGQKRLFEISVLDSQDKTTFETLEAV